MIEQLETKINSTVKNVIKKPFRTFFDLFCVVILFIVIMHNEDKYSYIFSNIWIFAGVIVTLGFIANILDLLLEKYIKRKEVENV